MLTAKKISIIILLIFPQILESTAQSMVKYNSILEKEIFCAISNGKWQDTVGFMLSADAKINYVIRDEVKKQLEDFIQPIKEKNLKRGNKKIIVKKLGRKLGDKYLKNYAKLSNFYETVTIGKYDCLTSTVLYAYFLEQLQLNYSIWETNYHIYIIVHLDDSDILIEPTDPDYGIICNKEAIEKHINTYRKGNDKKVDSFLSEFRIEREVNFLQLVGLQYYNKAVKQFNIQDYRGAVNSLKKSLSIYDCDRNRSFINYSMEYALSNHSMK